MCCIGRRNDEAMLSTVMTLPKDGFVQIGREDSGGGLMQTKCRQ